MVESVNRTNHWVLPKGGYETDEAQPEDAAARGSLPSTLPLSPPPPPLHTSISNMPSRTAGEAWEEAGITGRVTQALGEIHDSRLTPTKNGQPRTLYYFFEFHVEREEDCWPEMHKRKRRWLTYQEAATCFTNMNRPEMKEALDRSSVLR